MKLIKAQLAIALTSIMLLVSACGKTESDAVNQGVTATPAVNRSEQVSGAEQVMATIIEFEEVEAGLEPYVTRMTVSEHYIRIDDSGESDGYVLFDRLKKRIFSVVHDNQSILVVDPVRPLQPTPDELVIRSVLVKDDQAPSLAGVKPDYYQFFANDQLCYHLVAVDGFLPGISSALQSYQAVLAAQQQETLISTPEELQTPCFLANYIYAPAEYSSKGFPLEQWDVTGYHRSLTGVEENVSVDAALFALPKEYGFFSIGGGNVQM